MTVTSLLERIQVNLLHFLPSLDSPFWTAFGGALLGTLVALLLGYLLIRDNSKWSPAMIIHRDRRRRLPETIIVIRHGESEANADKSLWKMVPDNLLGLTKKGRHEARQVGKRVEELLAAQNSQRVHLVISPFERTLQTSQYLRKYFERRIVRTELESRIREQEVGNIQGDEFSQFRKQQRTIGRFWYRFPTGESGSDVLDRVKSWWFESVLTVNNRPQFEHVDAMVVVTHGLTMRFILMQLFGWSPTTFHSVWNAGNCDMYVLQKDLSKPGLSPYVLDPDRGDMPRSSIDVRITLRNGRTKTLKLNDYLSIPPPRMTRKKLIKHLLAQQYPTEIESHKDIEDIVFMPFTEGGVIRGRSSSGVYQHMKHHSINHAATVAQNVVDAAATATASTQRRNSSISDSGSSFEEDYNLNCDSKDATEVRISNAASLHDLANRVIMEEHYCDSTDDEEEDEADVSIHRARAAQEESLRYPCIKMIRDHL